jgi:hypothetical protein
MKVLELAQQMYCLQQKLDKEQLDRPVNGHHIVTHYNSFNDEGLKISCWDSKFNSLLAPIFNAELELLKDNDYPGDIEAAREALKKYLAQEVE